MDMIKKNNYMMAAGEAGEKKTGAVVFSRVMVAEQKTGVITLTGYVGSEYGDATVANFATNVQKLRDEGVTALDVVINSPGGSLWDGCGIYDILKGCGMRVTAKIYGVAASAATLIACAADKVLISANSRYMVHRMRGGMFGTCDECMAYLEDMKATEKLIVDVYAGRTGMSAAAVMEALDKETWMSAEEAVKGGWCDEVAGIVSDAVGIVNSERDDEEDGDADDDADADAEEGAVRKQSMSVWRRMFAAVGLSGDDADDETVAAALQNEVERLRAENAMLAAENDGLRGMQAEAGRVMAAHEAQYEARVAEGVVRAMAAAGVEPDVLPAPVSGEQCLSGAGEKMTNEKLAEMSAADAVAWIKGHPMEASRLVVK